MGAMRTLTMVFASCLLALACGDDSSRDGNGAPNDSTGEPPTVGANDEDGGKTGGPSPADPAALEVVLNEAAPFGPTEWLELANRGQVEVDLSDYFLADSDKATAQPKKHDAMKFPPGTTLQPHARILILTDKKSGTVGPHPKASCLPDGPETCLYASFGVSGSDGESIHLLAPDGNVVWSTAIPKSPKADAGAVIETDCRLPDMTGEFQKCAPTPGQPNRAP